MSESAAICRCGLQAEYAERGKEWRPLAGAIACEQLAFIADEAEAALSRPGPVTCERALRRIDGMAREALILMPKLVAQKDMEDTVSDIAEELARRARKRKGWCAVKTAVAREFAALEKARRSGQ